MRPNFSDETKEEILENCNWLCVYCSKRRVTDFHHCKKNSKVNQKKYPLFLQSKHNAASLCRECHESGSVVKFYRISDIEAQEWEDKLNENNA